RYVNSQKPAGARVLVGRDPRFLGENLVKLASEVLSKHGIIPLVIDDAAPTPAIAYEVIRSQADGAINFTASHNPPEYNGIKFSTPDGAPALPEVTRRIEAEIETADGSGNAAPSTPAERVNIEVKSHYLKRLAEIIDLEAIKAAKLTVGFDPFWG